MASSIDIVQEMIRQRNTKEMHEVETSQRSVETLNKTMMDAQTLQQNNRKFQIESLLAKSNIEKNLADIENSNMTSKLLNSFLNGDDPTSGTSKSSSSRTSGIKPTKVTIGGVTLENLGLNQQLEEEKNQRERVLKSRKDLDEFAPNAASSIMALKKIEEQSENLPDYKRGFYEQLTAKADVGIKSFNKDKDMTRYIATVEQEVIPIARNLAEEKGPINKDDIARIEKGLTDKTTPLEDKKFALNQFRRKLKTALEQKFRNADISEEEIKSKFPDLYEFINTDFTKEISDKGLSDLEALAKKKNIKVINA